MIPENYNKPARTKDTPALHMTVKDTTATTSDADRIIELQSKIRKAQIIQGGIGSLGTIAGIVYASKTGGGAWRYIGFAILGGIALGGLGYAFTLSMVNNAVTEIEKLKNKK